MEVADIGLDVERPTRRGPGWSTEQDVRAWLPERPVAAHKWATAVRLVAGSPGHDRRRRASRPPPPAGWGRLRPPLVAGDRPRDAGHRLVGADRGGRHRIARRRLGRRGRGRSRSFGALAVGPGLGTDPSVAPEVLRLVTAPVPIVVDGDGLRALGDDPAAALADRPVHLPLVVLTPHDGEFARLGGVLDGQPSRFDAVRDLATRTGAIVLLKGPTTLVGHPDGRVLATDQGDARLATAGTGDVLTGVLAAFLAWGVPPFEAAAAASFVHGRAARLGPPEGLIASDLPALITRWARMWARRSVGAPMADDALDAVARHMTTDVLTFRVDEPVPDAVRKMVDERRRRCAGRRRARAGSSACSVRPT